MTLNQKSLDLEDERTTQKRYRSKVRPKSVGTRGPAVSYGALLGRIALRGPNELLGGHGDFYIGESYANLDGVRVFSWAAPVACTFFRGSQHHELCHEVALIRAFEHQGENLVDFHDEPMSDQVPAEPFRKRTLRVPAAPRRPAKLRPPAPPMPRQPAPPVAETITTTTVRAEAMLRAQLAAPRTRSLAPVLATLQPDQYDLVTVPAMDSMIIEGQPGTGKTIVASHRAAYLVSRDTPPENTLDGSVLVVGPTAAYSHHVRDVINRLTGGSDRVRVLSLPELMMTILDMEKPPAGEISRTSQDVDENLARFVRAAIPHVRKKVLHPGCIDVYNHLRRNGTGDHPVTRDPKWMGYLYGLPTASDALAQRAHTPLMATIQWEIQKPPTLTGVEHIIVDEAQDVTALEWHLLASINEADAWTVIGDLNQRRSDHTKATWQEVVGLLDIPVGDPPIRRLERGYRSTRPILEYANRLLPAADRSVLAFQQDGPQPVVEKCSRTTLDTALVSQVKRLNAAYPKGTVAVITADPEAAETRLRRAGWARVRAGVWERTQREVTVTHPDGARGLEFDGVVVVEPADFPQNLGRQGPLYTALTRPNRELVVLHTKPLPDKLRVVS
ncbi:AAA family ATPase [Actinoplanes bogorensis]|uniref:AAA family ATPase n=1 Tax=Paractinoplanes bogorensis TaxID=1610840 RepID=A0ABS5YVD2_9ACTN|nr:AAA family ATPase [Actinoplanes bogorensis]MBU2667412.1 AAA family ATPase [Actinoplanes bogorensis]